MKAIWITGMMPIELLLFLLLIFVSFIIGHHLLKKKTGKSITALGQFFLLWITAYCFFKFVIDPPIPSALLYTYMGLISIVLFLLISATEQSWAEFKRPIFSTLLGETRVYRRIRAISFVVIPLFAGFGTYNYLNPKYEEPVELRFIHPAPPASISVHGQTFDLQKAKNPFRVDEKGSSSSR